MEPLFYECQECVEAGPHLQHVLHSKKKKSALHSKNQRRLQTWFRVRVDNYSNSCSVCMVIITWQATGTSVFLGYCEVPVFRLRDVTT